MTKTLTEQYKNKELSGWYYVKAKDGSINHWLLFTDSVEFETDKDIKEVLAPVPSYDHFSQLVKKVERLQEQLKEANEVIKLYGTPIYIEKHRDEKCVVTEIIPYTDQTRAKDYLEKWGVK